MASKVKERKREREKCAVKRFKGTLQNRCYTPLPLLYHHCHSSSPPKKKGPASLFVLHPVILYYHLLMNVSVYEMNDAYALRIQANIQCLLLCIIKVMNNIE